MTILAGIHTKTDGMSLADIVHWIEPDRPLNPPFIDVHSADITPGDVLEVKRIKGMTGRGGFGSVSYKTVAHISQRFYDDELHWMPFKWRWVTFTNGTRTRISNIKLNRVYGGPKFDQRNDPDYVAYYPKPLHQFLWVGEVV